MRAIPDNGADLGNLALMSFVTGAVICLKSFVRSRRACLSMLFNTRNASLTPTTVVANLVNTSQVKITFSIPEKYATQILALHNLHCSIHSDNLASVGLFEKAGFVRVGVRKEWYLEKGVWLDEILYQKCLERKETKK